MRPAAANGLPLLGLTLLLVAQAAPANGDKGTAWITPHQQFSSSVGVLGCKIDTNRVAYWPGNVDCQNICVSLTYEGRSLSLLRVDSSQGAHDVSYDAWNYLYTGYSARDKPVTGGGVAVDYEYVDPSACADLIHTDGNRLPLSASNAMNYLTSCLAQPDSWVASNYVLYNILDAICTWGFDEECSLDPPNNQPTCPHTLGLLEKLTTAPVYDIQYGTGQTVMASTGEVVQGSGLPGRHDTRPAPLVWGSWLVLLAAAALMVDF